MRLELTPDQAAELLSLLRRELKDTSRPVGAREDTQSADELWRRHQLLDHAAEAIAAALRLGTAGPSELEKEMAHPGD